MADFYVKQNDTKEPLQATLKDQAGVVTLTGATVRFHMRKRHSSAAKVDAAAVVVDAPNGVVKYAWQAADLDTPGVYHGEFEVTFSDQTIQSFPNDGHIEIEGTDDVA